MADPHDIPSYGPPDIFSYGWEAENAILAEIDKLYQGETDEVYLGKPDKTHDPCKEILMGIDELSKKSQGMEDDGFNKQMARLTTLYLRCELQARKKQPFPKVEDGSGKDKGKKRGGGGSGGGGDGFGPPQPIKLPEWDDPIE